MEEGIFTIGVWVNFEDVVNWVYFNLQPNDCKQLNFAEWVCMMLTIINSHFILIWSQSNYHFVNALVKRSFHVIIFYKRGKMK